MKNQFTYMDYLQQFEEIYNDFIQNPNDHTQDEF